jgi:hypothetical protein
MQHTVPQLLTNRTPLTIWQALDSQTMNNQKLKGECPS